jgi:hypothetical protein
MVQLRGRCGDEGAQVKADWCIQMGLVTKDPQNTEDKRLWLYEAPTGPKSSPGWQASSVQERCGDHPQPQLLIGNASSRDAGVSSTATVPKAKAKGKAKAKAKARPTCAADRILNLRLQIDKEIESMRNMVKEVSVDPMAKDMAEWMENYVTEMQNIKARNLDDEADTALHRIALLLVWNPGACRCRRCLMAARLAGRTEGSLGDDGNGGISRNVQRDVRGKQLGPTGFFSQGFFSAINWEQVARLEQLWARQVALHTVGPTALKSWSATAYHLVLAASRV